MIPSNQKIYSMKLSNGTLLHGGKYKIVRFISSGGFGNTYEAEHTLLKRRVAIKEFFVKDFCNRDTATSHVTIGTQGKRELVDKLKRKFIKEAIVIGRFDHPNIVKVSDIFEDNSTAYYVMDYIDGMSLKEQLDKSGALSEDKALRYIRQVADALSYVHSQDCLHLDIKPANIMIDRNDNALLVDFGACKQYDENGENTSTLLGINTIGYAPVEQMSKTFSDFNPAADVYALGATLYKLLTNITPPDSVQLMSGLQELAPLPSTVSENTRLAVEKAMIPIRKQRLQDMDAFVAVLDGKAQKPAKHNDKPTVKPSAKPKVSAQKKDVEATEIIVEVDSDKGEKKKEKTPLRDKYKYRAKDRVCFIFNKKFNPLVNLGILLQAFVAFAFVVICALGVLSSGRITEDDIQALLTVLCTCSFDFFSAISMHKCKKNSVSLLVVGYVLTVGLAVLFGYGDVSIMFVILAVVHIGAVRLFLFLPKNGKSAWRLFMENSAE